MLMSTADLPCSPIRTMCSTKRHTTTVSPNLSQKLNNSSSQKLSQKPSNSSSMSSNSPTSNNSLPSNLSQNSNMGNTPLSNFSQKPSDSSSISSVSQTSNNSLPSNLSQNSNTSLPSTLHSPSCDKSSSTDSSLQLPQPSFDGGRGLINAAIPIPKGKF